MISKTKLSNEQNTSEIDKRNNDHQNPLENHHYLHHKGSFQSVQRKSVNDYEDLIIEPPEQFRDRQKKQRPSKPTRKPPLPPPQRIISISST